MKTWKIGVLLLSLILFSFLISVIVLALDQPPMPPGFGQDPGEIVQNLTNFTTSKWDYLGQQWTELLTKNIIISTLNSFFTKISIFFQIILGIPYSLSLTFFIVLFFWFYAFLRITKLIQSTAKEEESSIKFIAPIVGIISAIFLAQIKIYYYLAKFFIWLLTAKKEWYYQIVIFLIIIAIFIVLLQFGSAIDKWLEKRRKEKQEKIKGEKLKEIREVLGEHDLREGAKDAARGAAFLKGMGKEVKNEEKWVGLRRVK